MQFLKGFIIIFIVLSCFAGVIYICSTILKKNRYKQIQGKKLSRHALLHETICSEFFRKNVFTGYFFPLMKDDNGVVREYKRIDSLIVTKGGISFTDAIDYATINPAKNLGIYGETGSIKVGKNADLVVLNKETFEVLLTIRNGKVIYKSK